MAKGGYSAVVRQVRTLFGGGVGGGASDAHLLERFSRGGSGPEAEAAFAVIVERHGPMVLGVCRRALPDPDDAADAFQATFLVLVRKAGSVRVDDSLGRWLYGVSRKVAARARAERARRRSRERPAIDPAGLDPGDEVERLETLAALDEEVSRLAEPFRSAVLLCDLEGLSHEEAARKLGCPVGTVESRLSRGRKRLRERLARRGLSPTAASLLPLAPPALPESLSASTVATATRATSAPESVSALLERVITDMTIAKIKTLAISLGLLTVACGLAVVAEQRLQADEKPAKKASESPAGVVLQPPAKLRPGNYLQIEVLEALPARPITGRRIVRPDGTISLGFYGDLKVGGLDRNQIKVALIKHMQKYLTDKALGLVTLNEDGKMVPAAPRDSDRVFVDDSSMYEGSTPAKVLPASDGPLPVKPGDILVIEVLEALPGRPITGARAVRPDGTVSLGFYGDLKVAGLNQKEIKVALIKHMQKYIKDEALGLVAINEKEDSRMAVPPEDSDRVLVDDSVIYEMALSGKKPTLLQAVSTIKPGDRLLIEVLEALPGRPITGERIVRPDGTVSLGFYGDLQVSGLTRREVKAKVVEHLRKYLSDRSLGLISLNENTGKDLVIDAEDSDRVFVDEDFYLIPTEFQRDTTESLGHKVDQLSTALYDHISKTGPHSSPQPGQASKPGQFDDHEQRLKAIESKLDRLIRGMEGMNADGKPKAP